LFENYIPPALFVTWQDLASRTIFPVGRLVRVGGQEPGYEFAYLLAARSAQEKGFAPFVAFPELEEVYRSRELPPFFQNRLMPEARSDFPAHLSDLGLDSSASPEAILARTNGRRATDPYEVFAEFEPTRVPGEWETRFFARSARYLAYPEALEKVTPRERLFCMRDVQNPADGKALALRTAGNALVGFCPAYLVDDLGALLDEPDAVVVTAEQLNPPPAPLQHRLLCHVRVRPKVGFHAYRSGRFEPLSSSAVRLTPWLHAAEVA
jgi:hypothetical protein